MTDTTGTGDTTVNVAHRTAPLNAGLQLKREYRTYRMAFTERFALPVDIGWQAAATHGATVGWAAQVAGVPIDDTETGDVIMFRITRAIRLAVQVPVGVIDGLLADGWTIGELSHLMDKNGYKTFTAGGFSGTVRRLRALHETVPGIGGPDGALLWHALAAVLSADPAGLTDLQTLRWLQVLVTPKQAAWVPRIVLATATSVVSAAVLQEWASVAGPDGWAWLAAGYTPDETRRLRALPNGHPDSPGPDQLAVMAALHER